MAYLNREAHFSYKMLATYQDQNQHGANAEYFKSGNAVPTGGWGPTGAWTFTPGSAIVPITITQAYDEAAIHINTESANHAGLELYAKIGAYIEQDLSNGYGVIVKRNINEAGANSLVSFVEDHTSSTQDVLKIQNDGTGVGIKVAGTSGSVAGLFESNFADAHVMAILNDGNNANRLGLQIAAGTDGAASNSNLITFTGGDGVVVGSITSAAGNVVLNAFTGGHPAPTKNNKKYPLGSVMILDSVFEHPKQKETKDIIMQPCYTLDISKKAKDKRAFSVYAGRYKGNPEKKSNLHHTFGLGDGFVLVCKENGNIEKGDYVTTSNKEGHAMKQDDDILHNYTIAKSLDDVNWKKEKKITKLVACTYHSS